MISTEKHRRFSCPLRKYCSLNSVINLSTRAPTNCLPFQKQTANDEVQTTLFCFATVEVGYNAVLTTLGHFTHFVHCRCTDVQVFTVLFRTIFLFKKNMSASITMSLLAVAWHIVRILYFLYTHVTRKTTSVLLEWTAPNTMVVSLL